MKNFLIRHFKSRGFKLRVKNWYIPAVKMAFAWVYNKPHGAVETSKFEKIYKRDKSLGAISNDFGTPVSSPASEVVLTYEQAVEIIKPHLINHKPQILGTCVAHSIKNAIRFATKLSMNRDMDLAEGDIYIDRDTLNFGIDSGMYPDRAIARVSEKGIAIQEIVPEAKTAEDLKTLTREYYSNELVNPFRVNLIKGSTPVASYRYFDALWAMITNDYKEKGMRPFQMTISSFTGWWGTDLPQATGKVRGSHSVIGIAIPFMYKGQRAFFAIDSAYYTGRAWRVGEGIRIVTEDCWNGLGVSARKLEFNEQIEKGLKISFPKITVSKSAQRGDSGRNVELIQRALISLGYEIPAIKNGTAGYGYYGKQTADAVGTWQLSNWEKFNGLNHYWNYETLAKLDGNSFGGLSVKVINTQLK